MHENELGKASGRSLHPKFAPMKRIIVYLIHGPQSVIGCLIQVKKFFTLRGYIWFCVQKGGSVASADRINVFLRAQKSSDTLPRPDSSVVV